MVTMVSGYGWIVQWRETLPCGFEDSRLRWSQMSDNFPEQGFHTLGLSEPILKAATDIGYEIPSPIQNRTIPEILRGNDIVGQAQTGTGKTAAFALPLLSALDIKRVEPQVLVLTPTRELSIQVSEAFLRYAKYLEGFHVVPIYGGQDISGQLRRLSRGVHVVVGTPGRVMDHMRRKTLKLTGMNCLVLDEADEMLRMGFLEDVKWILEQLPHKRQIALFSATMPPEIRNIAKTYLTTPVEILIQQKSSAPETVRQRFWPVDNFHKLDALTRILEFEVFEAMIIFVRTKNATIELTQKLEARGFAAEALNGDIPQSKREQVVARLKSKKLDIVVATDVAARGLDIDRISHVINFDMPYDPETYVHRIGRTGRAGRTGDAILFVSPRENHLLKSIERATKQEIKMMEMPSTKTLNDKRVDRFKQRITEALGAGSADLYREILEQYSLEQNVPPLDIAVALAKLLHEDAPLLIAAKAPVPAMPSGDRGKRPDRGPRPDHPRRDRKDDHGKNARARLLKPEMALGKRKNAKPFQPELIPVKRAEAKPAQPIPGKPSRTNSHPAKGMLRYRIDVGRNDGILPGAIVDTISRDAEIERRHVGQISIHDKFSTVDLPEGMPKEIFQALRKSMIGSKPLGITRGDPSLRKK